MSNAFKYTAKGMVKLSVSAKTGDGGSDSATLIFIVSDTGQGMTEEQVVRLFDKYSRFNAEANRETEGTGLGMSIARNLTDMMNGDISVTSEAGRGTTFTVSLPQASPSLKVLGKELAENLQNFQLNDMKQLRKAQIVYKPMPYGSILIVDDAESNLYVAQGLLAPYGLSIDTAKSGFEAIDKIKDGNVYDIVFMDHMMPKMDGIEATGIIRGLGYSSPVVALTANAVAGQEEVFLTNGFDGFISKPIDMRQLNAALKKFIRDKKPQIEPHLVEFFVQDAVRAVSTLEGISGKNGFYEDEDINMFTISVHMMKSALANIGESGLSSFAARLEQAGRNKNAGEMSSETPAFLSGLRAVIDKLTQQGQPDDNSGPSDEDYSYLREKLPAIKDACAMYDKRAIKDVLTQLRQKTWPRQIKELLDAMSGQLLGGDFEKVSDTAEKLTMIV